VGIMFGRENNGLSNSEISKANKIINIPTYNSTSLNLAQAIVIVCYELFSNDKALFQYTNSQQLATKQELEYFLSMLKSELKESGFLRIAEKEKIMMQNIQNIFTRIDKLSKAEIQTLIGIVKSLYHS